MKKKDHRHRVSAVETGSIAEELGLLDRVAEHGWKSLTSKETGRIGGLLNKRKHKN